MKTTFDEIIEQVLEHEGGYVNDPDDPGGETKFGIAKKFNPDVDIKNLTKEAFKKGFIQKNIKGVSGGILSEKTISLLSSL